MLFRSCEIVKKEEGADPASVVFDAIKVAKDKNADVLICDTAGRLHNKKYLMDELGKINNKSVSNSEEKLSVIFTPLSPLLCSRRFLIPRLSTTSSSVTRRLRAFSRRSLFFGKCISFRACLKPHKSKISLTCSGRGSFIDFGKSESACLTAFEIEIGRSHV